MDFNNYIKNLNKTLEAVDQKDVYNLIELLIDAYKRGIFVYLIGNGGSAANASHLAQDLAKGIKTHIDTAKRIRAMSLTDNVPFLTAQGNDEGYDSVFEQQLRTFAHPGDLLIAISGSGNSANIIKAVEWANKNGLNTVGITGYDGGKLKKIAKHSINVRLDDMCTSESIHTVIFHYIIIELHEHLKQLD